MAKLLYDRMARRLHWLGFAVIGCLWLIVVIGMSYIALHFIFKYW